MTTTARWLIDTSALRPHVPDFADALGPRVAAAQVGVCVVTELEVGYSARSSEEHRRVFESVLQFLVRIAITPRAESQAREVQAELVARGQHRAVGIPDLLVAAVANTEALTVLHYDRDFDLIADITGQPTEWLVPAGTV